MRLGTSKSALEKQPLAGASSKAAGVFPADLARVLMTAGEDDWKLVRWIEAPERSRFVSDLQQLGERLLL